MNFVRFLWDFLAGRKQIFNVNGDFFKPNENIVFCDDAAKLLIFRSFLWKCHRLKGQRSLRLGGLYRTDCDRFILMFICVDFHNKTRVWRPAGKWVRTSYSDQSGASGTLSFLRRHRSDREVERRRRLQSTLQLTSTRRQERPHADGREAAVQKHFQSATGNTRCLQNLRNLSPRYLILL